MTSFVCRRLQSLGMIQINATAWKLLPRQPRVTSLPVSC